ncbi:MAG: dethiobiotin synthase [Candidatus Saganbacteria bacterium]|nr:dethiobiotin synthase [Candidatus Saganbacteria bacterium]
MAGTDTEVGKTYVTALLAKELSKQGLKVGIMKPISCGPDNDAVYLKEKLGLDDPLELINPYQLPLPICPYANILHGKKFKFDIQKIKKTLKKLQKKYDLLLVEGVGGILVPITSNYLADDLIKDLGLSVIVVARAALGTINHTLLTVRSLQKKKIKILGIILNGFKRELSEESNPKIIEKLTGIKIIAKVPQKN